jgi:hypothetical protein
MRARAYFVTATDELDAEHVDVTLDSTDVWKEEVGDHAIMQKRSV